MIGFVYVLVNPYMPDLCKIGCTERSPHERAAELSKHTGVPAPFEVLCFIEVPGFQDIERDLHRWLDQYRVSTGREFFEDALANAVAWLWWHPKRLSFCAVPDSEPFGEPLLQREEFAPQFYSLPPGVLPRFDLLDNPWEKPAQEALEPVAALLVVRDPEGVL